MTPDERAPRTHRGVLRSERNSSTAASDNPFVGFAATVTLKLKAIAVAIGEVLVPAPQPVLVPVVAVSARPLSREPWRRRCAARY